jgi:hypothetical protein
MFGRNVGNFLSTLRPISKGNLHDTFDVYEDSWNHLKNAWWNERRQFMHFHYVSPPLHANAG